MRIARQCGCVILLLAAVCCMARGEGASIPWDRMNGEYQQAENGLILRDSPQNPVGRSYVYYDTQKKGDIDFSIRFCDFAETAGTTLTLRIEETGNDANSAEIVVKDGRATFSAYDNKRKPSCTAEAALESKTGAALGLRYDAAAGTMSALVDGQPLGEWKMEDFIVPHRVRIELNGQSTTDACAVTISEISLYYSEEEVTKTMIPETLSLENDLFHLELSTKRHGLTQLKRVLDSYDTNYARTEDDDLLGNITFRYAVPEDAANNDYRTINTRQCKVNYTWDDQAIILTYPDMLSRGLALEEKWLLDGDEMRWEMTVKNISGKTLTIGDIELHFAFNQAYAKDTTTTYTKRLVRHSFCSLDGSFAYWCRPNGEGPMLTMVPAAGTALEYYTRDWAKESAGWEGPYSMFIHSQATGSATPGDWALPHTALTLEDGQSKTYSLRFAWAKDEQDVRNVLYQLGGVDAIALPGMTVTPEFPVKLALRSQEDIHDLIAPEGCTIQFIGEKDGYRLYDVAFSKIGENRMEVVFGEGRRMMLDFFVTHPIAELLSDRAHHITQYQQYRGDTWYDGLFSSWDMKYLQLGTPDNPMGMYRYITGGSDDPSLCKAPFLAEKNLAYPVQNEIEAIEYYIEHFVWGGLQRTDTELPRPYGIYGCDYWYELRNSGTGINNGGHGEDRMWRTFDYVHITQLYYYMYQIARLYPDMVQYLAADDYLTRAYGTAMAFFEVPISIFMDTAWAIQGYADWAYKQGNFNELVIPWIIDALEAEGRGEEAARLREQWEMKVKYMVYDHPYPFGSEMWFDSTAFESTHAVAKYGMEHDVSTDTTGFYDPNANGPGQGAYLKPHTEIKKEDFEQFMEKELQANIAARAVIEPAYYLMGSDYRQGGNSNYTLSYMTQLGGWSLFDAACYYSDTPELDIRTAYAAYLAGWMLINTGEDYPWYGTAENEGAAGWAFEPGKTGSPWIGANYADPRGPWRVDGEIDAGFSGGIRTAASVLVEDPLFGLYLYGGRVEETENGLLLHIADGLNQRLHILSGAAPLHLTLDRDGLKNVLITKDALVMTLENRTGDTHAVSFTLQREATESFTFEAPASSSYQVTILLK